MVSVGNIVPAEAVSALDDCARGSGTLFVSPVVAWEMGMPVSEGHRLPPMDPLTACSHLCELPNADQPESTPGILVGSSFPAGRPPNDPFDRTIIATARQCSLTVPTRDRLILDDAAQGHVAALAC